MKVLNQIRKFFNLTFAIFTFVTLFMVTYNLMTTDVQHLVMATKSKVGELYWQIMLFAAVTSLAATVVDLFKKLNGIVARLIKFIFSYGAFALWFFVLSVPAAEGLVKPAIVITASVIFVVIYAAVVAFTAFAKWLIVKLFGKKDGVYESVYKKAEKIKTKDN